MDGHADVRVPWSCACLVGEKGEIFCIGKRGGTVFNAKIFGDFEELNTAGLLRSPGRLCRLQCTTDF